jgi:hypothetical protein
MPKIKTFTSDLAIFKTNSQLENLDNTVNDFLEKNHIKTIFAVNDTTTCNENGATIGLVRTIVYE